MENTAPKLVKIQISQKGETGLRAGHPWVYDTEVLPLVQPCTDGSLVEVRSAKGRYLGAGFYNSRSKIRVRVISTNANDRFDRGFFRRRLSHAWEYRKTVMGKDLDCCRLIFGEADFFPGLTVDRFGDILVTQTLCLGIERIKPMLFEELYRLLAKDGQTIRGIYERNDVAIRRLEGLEEYKGFFSLPGLPPPERTDTQITENGVRYRVDFENGQKTGFFLDQKYNRRAAAALAPGKRVLDCFTHTGSFALNAAKAGATYVHAVDISQDAVDLARQNAALNGLSDRVRFETANVFDLLSALPNHSYDYIILDPPAFTKSRHTVDAALRGYKQINLRAMRLLPRGGYLATCSCSHFMTEELFCQMLRCAAFDAKVSLRQIEARQQAADHPILWNVPQTNYLKFYLFQIV
ncbi:MAG: class I SAM-dependent rRNA methyltransferase [Oscillospiraceae bacterium]|nr:class I SAM-dependent rRNA methyltransferase [Oscillospiraceae bacterium]